MFREISVLWVRSNTNRFWNDHHGLECGSHAPARQQGCRMPKVLLLDTIGITSTLIRLPFAIGAWAARPPAAAGAPMRCFILRSVRWCASHMASWRAHALGHPVAHRRRRGLVVRADAASRRGLTHALGRYLAQPLIQAVRRLACCALRSAQDTRREVSRHGRDSTTNRTCASLDLGELGCWAEGKLRSE